MCHSRRTQHQLDRHLHRRRLKASIQRMGIIQLGNMVHLHSKELLLGSMKLLLDSMELLLPGSLLRIPRKRRHLVSSRHTHKHHRTHRHILGTLLPMGTLLARGGMDIIRITSSILVTRPIQDSTLVTRPNQGAMVGSTLDSTRRHLLRPRGRCLQRHILLLVGSILRHRLQGLGLQDRRQEPIQVKRLQLLAKGTRVRKVGHQL